MSTRIFHPSVVEAAAKAIWEENTQKMVVDYSTSRNLTPHAVPWNAVDEFTRIRFREMAIVVLRAADAAQHAYDRSHSMRADAEASVRVSRVKQYRAAFDSAGLREAVDAVDAGWTYGAPRQAPPENRARWE